MSICGPIHLQHWYPNYQNLDIYSGCDIHTIDISIYIFQNIYIHILYITSRIHIHIWRPPGRLNGGVWGGGCPPGIKIRFLPVID